MSVGEVLSGAALWHVEQGDCLDVLRAMPDASVDAVVTDPPYATTGESSVWVSKDKIRSLPRETQFYEAWLREHLTEWARVLKPSGAFWMSCDWAAAMALDRACSRVGLRAPVIGVWHREGLGMGFVLRHVYECFAIVTMPKFERIATDEPDVWVHKWTPADRDHGHSAEKPIPLMERAIRLLVRSGGVVCDPFSGSGTTGVAAARLGCRFVGIERDEEHATRSRDRLAAEERGLSLAAATAGQTSIFDRVKESP